MFHMQLLVLHDNEFNSVFHFSIELAYDHHNVTVGIIISSFGQWISFHKCISRIKINCKFSKFPLQIFCSNFPGTHGLQILCHLLPGQGMWLLQICISLESPTHFFPPYCG